MMNCLGFMPILLFLFVTIASAYFNPFNVYWDPSFDYLRVRVDRIEQIIANVNNKANSTWTAGLNFDERLNIKNLLGTSATDLHTRNDLDVVDVSCHRSKDDDDNEEKDEHVQVFDAREAWPSCPEIGRIRNQGRCASDWVLAPVSVIGDRWCIAKNGTEHFDASPHESLSCCKSCGWGCEKGYPKTVYTQFVNKGFASGGDYNSSQGCQPYEVGPCQSYEQCLKERISKTPTCKRYCYNENFNRTYQEDIRRGFKVIKARCPCSAAKEMTKRGPISASMVVYEDFLTYKSGIYQHVYGEKLGRLTMKLIGFNDTHDPKYWIAVNSWGPNWGEGGTFKIVRGESDCFVNKALYGIWIDEVHGHYNKD